MKTPRRRHLTPHRRQRLVLWALAMLMWIASLLAGLTPTRRQLAQRGDISLDGLSWLVQRLILIRGGELAGYNRNRPCFFKCGRDLRRAHVLRSICGSKLRQALDHRDPIARIAILIDALTHLDAWAARFAKRLRRGITRLWSIAPAPMPAIALLGPPASPPACADSS
jgi:hypothetical protein